MAGTRQRDRRQKHIAGGGDAVLDRRVASKRKEETGERGDASALLRRLPHQTTREMRTIGVEIAAEERRQEWNNDGDGMLEARQLAPKPKISLIRAEAVHAKVHRLQAEHRLDLRRNAFVVGQAVAEDHGLAGKQQRRTIEVDTIAGALDSIASRVECILDRPSTVHSVRDAIGD